MPSVYDTHKGVTVVALAVPGGYGALVLGDTLAESVRLDGVFTSPEAALVAAKAVAGS